MDCGERSAPPAIVEQHRQWLAESGRDAVAAIWWANRVAAASPSPEDPPEEVTTRQTRESRSRSC
jgi:hypothetical protein